MNQPPYPLRGPAFAGLLLLLAGGCYLPGPASKTPTYAKTLSYTNPPVSGFSLQADPNSNNTSHLVLNLVGPSGTVAQGVSFFVTADPAKVTWSKTAGFYAIPAAVFILGSAPQAFQTLVSATGDLQVGLYQKSGSVPLAGDALVAVALDLKSNAVAPGSTVALAVTPGKQPVYVDAAGTVRPFPAPIAIGTLTGN